MMGSRFFIMIHELWLVMDTEDNKTAFFHTLAEARAKAAEHAACKAYGYDIYQIGEGHQ